MSLDKKTSTDIVSGGNKTPLVIFKTKEDRNETDISKMSNFFEDYVHEMTLSIRESSHLQEIMELPIADLSVIGDVINQADIIVQGNITLLPDFENLPSNMDFWYNFSVEMKPALKKSMEQLKLEATDSDDKEVYFVSVEDSEDE